MSRSDGSTADYYELPAGATELQDLISHRNMNAQIGEIFRAGYRYGLASHSDMLRDAKKMRFYADAEVKRLEKLQRESAGWTDEAIKAAAFKDPHDTFGKPLPLEPAADIDDESDRQKLIQQSGEMAEEVYAAVDGRPSWDDAPEWAMWLAQQEHGAWEFYEDKPTCERGTYWRHELNGVRVSADDKTRANPNWRNTLQARPQKDATQ